MLTCNPAHLKVFKYTHWAVPSINENVIILGNQKICEQNQCSTAQRMRAGCATINIMLKGLQTDTLAFWATSAHALTCAEPLIFVQLFSFILQHHYWYRSKYVILFICTYLLMSQKNSMARWVSLLISYIVYLIICGFNSFHKINNFIKISWMTYEWTFLKKKQLISNKI